MTNKTITTTKKERTFEIGDFYNMLDKEVRLAYKGPWDKQIMLAFGNYLKILAQEQKTINKKIFRIFMELAENISLYSAEYRRMANGRNAGIGSLVVRENENSFSFYTGNVVQNVDIFPIIDKCEIINSLDRENLRDFKRRQRSLPHGEKGGANIGLIQIALTSDGPIDIKLTPIDEYSSFFGVQVLLDKFM